MQYGWPVPGEKYIAVSDKTVVSLDHINFKKK
jgi:hypothetical protein